MSDAGPRSWGTVTSWWPNWACCGRGCGTVAAGAVRAGRGGCWWRGDRRRAGGAGGSAGPAGRAEHPGRAAGGFGLTPFERSVLLLAAGPELVAAVGDDLTSATGGSRRRSAWRWLRFQRRTGAPLLPAGALRRWNLVELLDPASPTRSPLMIDERVLHHLAGAGHLDARLAGHGPAAAAAPSGCRTPWSAGAGGAGGLGPGPEGAAARAAARQRARGRRGQGGRARRRGPEPAGDRRGRPASRSRCPRPDAAADIGAGDRPGRAGLGRRRGERVPRGTCRAQPGPRSVDVPRRIDRRHRRGAAPPVG